MKDDQGTYNVAAIRKLLLAAYDPVELRRFCQDRPLFEPLLARFSPHDGLETMVDRTIDYCRIKLLWAELLAEIRDDNPRQYARLEAELVRRVVPRATPPALPGNRLPAEARPRRAWARSWPLFGAAALALLVTVLALTTLLNPGVEGTATATVEPTDSAVAYLTARPSAIPKTATPSPPTAPPTDSPTPTATRAPTATPTSMQTEVPPPQAGATMVWDVDDSTLVYVPEGTFLMGSTGADSVAESDEKPQHQVYLDAFWIDRTEVTNAQYRHCVEAGGCSPPGQTGSYTRDIYYGEPQFDEYPVIHVNWEQADAYCTWAGKRLPTEAEWEKAARGDDGRLYPWGNEAPNCERANYDGKDGAGWCVGDTTEVGSYPTEASSYGALDMAGNVWEWVADWYAGDYYAHSPDRNPQGPDSDDMRVMRGGSWFNSRAGVRAAYRAVGDPSHISIDVGLRCARSDSES